MANVLHAFGIMTQRMSCQSMLVVLLIIELLVSFGIGCILYHRKEIVYVTLLKYPFLYFGIWGVRAVLVGLILIAVALRNLRLCRMTWFCHLPIVLITMFTVAPLVQIHCACTDYWDCTALSAFTNLGDNFLNPFIPPQAQIARDGTHFAIKKPPSAQETALTQLQASETLQVEGSHKHRKSMRTPRQGWILRSDLVKNQEDELSGMICEELPQQDRTLPVKVILKIYGDALEKRVLVPENKWGKADRAYDLLAWESKVAELVTKCDAGVERNLCEQFGFTLTIKKDPAGTPLGVCLEWDSEQATHSVPQDSETANSVSFFYSKSTSQAIEQIFHDTQEWERTLDTVIQKLVMDEYMYNCRCDPVLNDFASCNVYYDPFFSERFWCYIDPRTKSSCERKGFKLTKDSEGHLWTEDLCRRIHADGDGCGCAGFGIKSSAVKMPLATETPLGNETKDEWRFGSYCKDWAGDQKQFCFVGFDTACSDRHLVDFAVGSTKGYIFRSTLPCVKQHQTKTLRDAHTYCTTFSWCLLFGILCFNGFCAWTSLAIYHFIANRCGDAFKASAQQFAAESDDDDTWDVNTG